MAAGDKAYSCPFYLPPEVWAPITHLLDGDQLGRLKLTGSKSLWLQISAYRSVKSVNIGTDYLLYKTWPAYLNEFPSLEELEISTINKLWLASRPPKLDQLPKKLRKLSLNFEQSYLDAFFLGHDGSILSLAEQMPQLESLTLRATWSSKRPWMNHMPSNLTFLHCHSVDGSLPLPASLTHLTVNETWSDPISMPPYLTHLKVGSIIVNPSLEAFIQLLPASLQVFKTSIRRHVWKRELMDLLPKSITQLELSLTKLTSAPHIAPAELHMWPTHLQKLRITRLESENWIALPSTLETLEIDQILRSNFNVKLAPKAPNNWDRYTIPFQDLPRSLKHFSGKAIEEQFVDCDFVPQSGPPSHLRPSRTSLFPPSLSYLRLDDIQISVEVAKQLPPSLTALSIGFLNEHVCEHLPSGINRISCRKALINQDVVNFLPKSLTKLRLFFAHPFANVFDAESGDCKPLFDRKSHTASEGQLSHIDWHPIPPGLTSLELYQFEYLGDHFASIVPNLTSLTFPSETGFTNASIAQLPRSLIVLEILAKDVTGACFATLPKGLETLSLRGGQVVDADIPYLPQSLKYCTLDTHHLTDSCVKHFPRSLKFLLLDNCNLSKGCIPDLPCEVRAAGTSFRINTISWYLDDGVAVNYDAFSPESPPEAL